MGSASDGVGSLLDPGILHPDWGHRHDGDTHTRPILSHVEYGYIIHVLFYGYASA